MNPFVAVFDIDGTLRTVADPWLHLHTHLGTLEHRAAFCRRWLAGEISYSEMAGLDASVWKGVYRGSMLACLESNPIRRGADGLVRWFKSRQIPCIGISTGLYLWVSRRCHSLGLDGRWSSGREEGKTYACVHVSDLP